MKRSMRSLKRVAAILGIVTFWTIFMGAFGFKILNGLFEVYSGPPIDLYQKLIFFMGLFCVLTLLCFRKWIFE